MPARVAISVIALATLKILQKRLYNICSTPSGLICLTCTFLAVITLVAYIFLHGLRAVWIAPVCYTSTDNIGGRSFSELCPPPIDVVYTWVNGTDPLWQQSVKDYRNAQSSTLNSSSSDLRWSGQYSRRLFIDDFVDDYPMDDFPHMKSGYWHDNPDEELTQSESERAKNDSVLAMRLDPAGINRYRDNGELKYSLRSLEKYAPWIRHVYIVTNGQVPNWLNLRNSRISIVTHDEIFSNKSALPVFASPAIETQLHKIPGLSNKFIYFNDDVFLGAPSWPADFWTPDEGQKVYTTYPIPQCSAGCMHAWINDGHCDAACNNDPCLWDGGDCENFNTSGDVTNVPGDTQTPYIRADECAPGCIVSWLADRTCDMPCNVAACGFDLGDCGMKSVWSVNNGTTLTPSTSARSIKVNNASSTSIAYKRDSMVCISLADDTATYGSKLDLSFDMVPITQQLDTAAFYVNISTAIDTSAAITTSALIARQISPQSNATISNCTVCLPLRDIHSVGIQPDESNSRTNSDGSIRWQPHLKLTKAAQQLYPEQASSVLLAPFGVLLYLGGTISHQTRLEKSMEVIQFRGHTISISFDSDVSLLYEIIASITTKSEFLSKSRFPYRISIHDVLLGDWALRHANTIIFPILYGEEPAAKLAAKLLGQSLSIVLEYSSIKHKHQIRTIMRVLKILLEHLCDGSQKLDDTTLSREWPRSRTWTIEPNACIISTILTRARTVNAMQASGHIDVNISPIKFEQMISKLLQRQSVYRCSYDPNLVDLLPLDTRKAITELQGRGCTLIQAPREGWNRSYERPSAEASLHFDLSLFSKTKIIDNLWNTSTQLLVNISDLTTDRSLLDSSKSERRLSHARPMDEGHLRIVNMGKYSKLPYRRILINRHALYIPIRMLDHHILSTVRKDPKRLKILKKTVHDSRAPTQVKLVWRHLVAQASKQYIRRRSNPSYTEHMPNYPIRNNSTVVSTRARKLDLFADSISYTDHLLSSKLKRQERKVIAHMPHMIDKNVMNELERTFQSEFDATSKHKFRHPRDIQYAFAYFYWLMEGSTLFNADLDTFWQEEIDTNGDGVLDPNEFITLASVVYNREPNVDEANVLLSCIMGYSEMSHDVFRDKVSPSSAQETFPVESITPFSIAKCRLAMSGLVDYAPKPVRFTEGRLSHTSFEMITDDPKKTRTQLHNLRAKRSKFVCINDDMVEAPDEVVEMLHDFYESYFPLPSQFELPPGQRNDYLYIDVYRKTRPGRRVLKMSILLLSVGTICIVVIMYRCNLRCSCRPRRDTKLR